MSTYKIAVCDDEEDALSLISELVKREFAKLGENTEISAFTNSELLLESNREESFDVNFLDISMPSIDGIEVAGLIKRYNPETLIVFVTCMDDLVFKSYKVHPFGFIRKTKLIEEFPAVVLDIKKQLSYNEYSLCFKLEGTEYRLCTDEVVFIESKGNYIKIKTTDMADYRYKDSINKKEIELKEHGFVRTHERFLVNLKYISKINKKSVTMIQNYGIPVSRNRMKAVIESYYSYHGHYES